MWNLGGPVIEQFFDPLGKLDQKKKAEKHNNKREDVERMIKDALASGDVSLMSAGKTPQSGLQYEPRYTKLLSPTTSTDAVKPAADPNAGGQQASLPVGNSEEANRNWIIQKESEGVPTAKNPNSSAYGLGQLIKSNREAYAKRFGFSPDTTDPQEQLQMMDAYVKERYGSYAEARKFWEEHNWY